MVQRDKLEETELLGSLSFDSMQFKSGLCFVRGTLQLAGFDDSWGERGFLEGEYFHTASQSAERSSQSPPILASHYMAYFFTSATGKIKQVIGRHLWGSVKTEQIQLAVRSALSALYTHRLIVLAVCSDGASENRSFVKTMFPHLLPARAGIADCKGYMLHPSDPEYRIFFLADPWHLVKKIRNALLHTGEDKHKRKLTLNGELLSLEMLGRAWLETGGAAGGGLRQSKLTHNHFWGLDSHYKMKVSPAAQVFSASMRRIIAQLCGDDDDLLTRYAGVDQLCEEMDVYIDIMNSTSESSSKQKKQGLHHQSVSKESGACQERLLGVLRFFTSWKESTDNPDQFIPQQSYEDLCWSINGNVSLVEYYTHMFPTFKWRLKCVSTDCCENHFANTRYFSGSGANATAVNCLKASETGNGISSGKGVGLQLQFAKSNNGGT